MEIIISKNSAEASALAAEIFKRQMEEKPNSVLGLATGGTVVELYNELAKMCAEKRISAGGTSVASIEVQLDYIKDFLYGCK